MQNRYSLYDFRKSEIDSATAARLIPEIAQTDYFLTSVNTYAISEFCKEYPEHQDLLWQNLLASNLSFVHHE